MFTENKITEFKNRIATLADRPQMSAQALKEYFDSSAEELRVKFNALIDALDSFGAASLDAVDYNAAEYKLTFTFKNGSTQTIDLPLELLIESGHYDAEKESIVLTLANSDVIIIPVSDLIDVYKADEKTLTCKDNTFSVKDGVFAPEADKDGVLYGRKDGKWEKVIDSLPELAIEQADEIREGVYRVCQGDNIGVLCSSLDIYVYDENVDIEQQQTVIWSDGRILKRSRLDGVMDISNVVENADGTYSLKPGYVFYDEWSAWESIIPSLTGYAKTSYVDATADALKADRKLKLLKTITLEEDVSSITVDFDKPLDEISILFDVAFLKEETKAIAAHTDGGAWYMFWASGAMKTTKQYFFAHAKEYAERYWECFVSGGFFGGLQGISNSVTTPKQFLSSRKRVANLNRFISKLNIFMPNNTSENAFATGSTIEIWGHEADEE